MKNNPKVVLILPLVLVTMSGGSLCSLIINPLTEWYDLQKGRKSWWDSTKGTLGHMLIRIVVSEFVKGVNTG